MEKWHPVNSSNLDAVAYDDDEMALGIRFKDGSEYHYTPVPEEEFNDILESSSPGSYFRQFIRDRYRFTKVKDKDD